MTYRPRLTGQALRQFQDLQADPVVYRALMDRLLRLVEEPWDAWPVYAARGEPDVRMTQFGEHGLLSFTVDDTTEVLIVLYILWAG